jgi:hypothetical protein
MTEAEWLDCLDPEPMLTFLRNRGSNRKFRLFAVEIVRHLSEWLVHADSRAAVEAAACVAEGVSSPSVLSDHYRTAWAVLPLEPYSDLHVSAARAAARTVQEQADKAAELTKNEVVEFYARLEEEKFTTEDEKYEAYWIGKAQGQAILASCLRDIFGNPFRLVSLDPAWQTPTVSSLAHAAYEERFPTGHLDPARLAILADALEEAGCTDRDILDHLRSPGPHVRGCFVIDLLTGRGDGG